MKNLIEGFERMACRANLYEQVDDLLTRFCDDGGSSMKTESPLKQRLAVTHEDLLLGHNDIVEQVVHIYGLGSRPLPPVKNLDDFIAKAVCLPPCRDSALQHMDMNAQAEEKARLKTEEDARRLAEEDAHRVAKATRL
jgi:hypothetical protein